MLVPLSWLRELVAIDAPTDDLSVLVTMGATNVEEVTRPTAGTRGVVVAEVRTAEPVPGSDKLTLVEVTTDGSDAHAIVCGAKNFAVGDRVAAALPGAVLSNGMQIGRRTMVGIESNGMLCSPRELGVGSDHSGIWVLGADAPLGADLVTWLGLDDEVMELEVTPDRGYLLSISGLARDVAALTGAALTLPSPPDLGPLVDSGVPVTGDDPTACPRFTTTRIEGVDVTRRTPAPLQVRLAHAGMRAISPVVDATNLAMLETGQPTHAYDLARLDGPGLGVRSARAGETVATLDEVTRTLEEGDLVIVDGTDAVIGMAGVMGGASTEVSASTDTVVLEAAAFDAARVLRTGRRHNLLSEASRRFEKTVPTQLVADGALRTAALIAELTGGRVTGFSDTAPDPAPPAPVALRPATAPALLGIALEPGRQRELLESIGCRVDEADGHLAVHPPAYRPDLLIEVDLVEELVRLHGMEEVPATLPSAGRVGRRDPEHDARMGVRRRLAGGGWSEVLTLPFTAVDVGVGLGWSADDRRSDPVELVNPLSAEAAALRSSLLPGLLAVVARNVARQNPDVAVFEVGHVFWRPDDSERGAHGGPHDVVLPADPMMVGFAACGAFAPARHDDSGRPVDLYDVLGAVELVRGVLGRGRIDAVAAAEMPYHPGRCARLLLDGAEVGVVGELHPRVVARLGVPARTVAGELRLDRLVAGGITPAIAHSPSPLPSLRFDVAAEVPADVPAAAVEAAVRAGAGTNLSELRLFDVYEGESLGEGRRSLAFTLRMDDPTRQLTDADAADAIEAIDAAVSERLGGRLRR